MRERAGRHDPVPGADPEHARAPPGVGEQVVVAERHRLGPAGRTRGVEHDERPGSIGAFRAGTGLVLERFERNGSLRSATRDNDVSQRGQPLLEAQHGLGDGEISRRLLTDDRDGFAESQRPLALGLAEGQMEPGHNRPDAAKRDVNGNPVRSVAQLDPDHVAHADSEPPEPAGEAIAQRAEFGESHALFGHDDRGGARYFRDGPVEPVGQELVAPQPFAAVARGERRIVGHRVGQPRAGFAPVVHRRGFLHRACPGHRARD